jgi:hypothetical protein
MKESGEATDWTTIDDGDDGVGWIAYPDETMQRASHAVVTDGDVWLIDPVDTPGLDDLLAERGEVAGVVTLLDRHKRDAAAIANRHDVSVYLPGPLAGIGDELDAPTEPVSGPLPGTDYAPITVVDSFYWTEVALFDGSTLVVAESVGTGDYFLTADERLGVHPMRRIVPPRGPLGGLGPDRIRVGHGEGVDVDPGAALDDALRGSRKRMMKLYVETGLNALGG